MYIYTEKFAVHNASVGLAQARPNKTFSLYEVAAITTATYTHVIMDEIS